MDIRSSSCSSALSVPPLGLRLAGLLLSVSLFVAHTAATKLINTVGSSTAFSRNRVTYDTSQTGTWDTEQDWPICQDWPVRRRKSMPSGRTTQPKSVANTARARHIRMQAKSCSQALASREIGWLFLGPKAKTFNHSDSHITPG